MTSPENSSEPAAAPAMPAGAEPSLPDDVEHGARIAHQVFEESLVPWMGYTGVQLVEFAEEAANDPRIGALQAISFTGWLQMPLTRLYHNAVAESNEAAAQEWRQVARVVSDINKMLCEELEGPQGFAALWAQTKLLGRQAVGWVSRKSSKTEDQAKSITEAKIKGDML